MPSHHGRNNRFNRCLLRPNTASEHSVLKTRARRTWNLFQLLLLLVDPLRFNPLLVARGTSEQTYMRAPARASLLVDDDTFWRFARPFPATTFTLFCFVLGLFSTSLLVLHKRGMAAGAPSPWP